MTKKKIFGLIAVLSIAVMAAFNVSMNADENGWTDISLANVEALAGGEIDVGKPCAQTCQMCWCMWFWDDGEVDEAPGEFRD